MFFFHIHKTGGQSVAEICSALFPAEDCAINQKRISVDTLKKKRFVSGHGYWSELCDSGSEVNLGGFFSFTFLRNPLDRLISAQYHVARDPTEVSSGMIENAIYLHRFSKLVPFDNYSQEEHFRSAMDVLINEFYFVGISDNIGAAVSDLWSSMDIPEKYLNILKINARPQDCSYQVPHIDLECFFEKNKYDIEIFKFFNAQARGRGVNNIIKENEENYRSYINWSPADPLFGSLPLS